MGTDGRAGQGTPPDDAVEPDALQRQFIGWQCRIRQYAVRKQAGQPSAGMRPQVVVDGKPVAAITVLIIYRQPEAVTAQFRFIVQRSRDPRMRYEAALKLLAAHYYQLPDTFAGSLTAVFSLESRLAAELIAGGRCGLQFVQANQGYTLECTVASLPWSSPACQTTYWHNYLFHPQLPGRVRVLGFYPDWASSSAFNIRSDPAPGARSRAAG